MQKMRDIVSFGLPTKLTRLARFDDEVDVKAVRSLLKGIKDDVEGTLLVQKAFDIDQYVKFFINAYCFDKPKQILYEDISEITERLYKTFFRFEYEKKDRPTLEEDRKTLKRIIDTANQKKYAKKVIGEFDDTVTFDFITDEYKIKIFDYDNKDLSRLINSAKTWAWNGTHNTGQKIMIIYRYSSENSNEKNKAAFRTIESILFESGIEVFDLDNGIEKIQSSLLQSS